MVGMYLSSQQRCVLIFLLLVVVLCCCCGSCTSFSTSSTTFTRTLLPLALSSSSSSSSSSSLFHHPAGTIVLRPLVSVFNNNCNNYKTKASKKIHHFHHHSTTRITMSLSNSNMAAAADDNDMPENISNDIASAVPPAAVPVPVPAAAAAAAAAAVPPPSTSSTSSTTPLTIIDSLSFISDICGILKTLKRTGWVRSGIPNPESDADHMHRCAMCALLVTQNPPDSRDDYSTPQTQMYHPSNVNTTKLLRMTVTHDLCEALVGDITPYCNPNLVKTKHEKEFQAMITISSKILGPSSNLGLDLVELWKEYEQQITIESIYCKDIDKFEMIVQAYEYEKLYLQYNTKKNNNTSDDTSISSSSSPKSKKARLEETKKDEDNNNNNNEMEEKNNSNSNLVLKEPLRTFFISTNTQIKTPMFRRLDLEVRQRRKLLLLERGWEISSIEEQQQEQPEPEVQQEQK